MKSSKIKLYVYIGVGMVAVASMVLMMIYKPWKTLDTDLHG